MIYNTKNVEETEALASEIAGNTKPPHVFCLTGDLGAGKTAFTRGLARGFGYDGRVSSPTFTILNIYEGNPCIYHYDLYRLSSFEELEETGIESSLDKGISVIEWPDEFMELFEGATLVTITATGDTERMIEIKTIE